MQVGQLTIDSERLAAFCKRWKIAELSVFGSVLRDDFRPDSDVDFLVTFEPGERWSYFEYADMKAELAAIVGRPVDVAQHHLVESDYNWVRRRAILDSAQQLYAA